MRRARSLENGFGELALLPGKTQVRTARGLPAHSRSFAQTQENGIGRRAQMEGPCDARRVLIVDCDARRMQHLGFRENRAQTRRDADVTFLVRGSPPGPAHLGRCVRQRTDHGEPPH